MRNAVRLRMVEPISDRGDAIKSGRRQILAIALDHPHSAAALAWIARIDPVAAFEGVYIVRGRFGTAAEVILAMRDAGIDVPAMAVALTPDVDAAASQTSSPQSLRELGLWVDPPGSAGHRSDPPRD